MEKQSLLYGVIGLLGGILIAVFVASTAVNAGNTGIMGMMGMNTGGMNMNGDSTSGDHMGMSMDEMTTSLKNKTGDNFDKAFLAEMIDHHQGAIDMANLAKTNAKHDEIKKLADDILATQSKEIDQMQTWQGNWGYKNVPTK